MDFQNRVGSKPGMGGVASAQEMALHRRERLRKLAQETIDVSKDPYLMKNHLGTFECKLCLTIHSNEGSYLAHTQNRKHQMNLARRALKDSREGQQLGAKGAAGPDQAVPTKHVVKIGRPGYKVIKIRDPETQAGGLLFHIHYPELAKDAVPRHRFMSAFEQRVERPDRRFQYLIFAAEPYENIAFRIDSRELEKNDRFFTYYDKDAQVFTLQLLYKSHYPSVQQAMPVGMPMMPIMPGMMPHAAVGMMPGQPYMAPQH